MLMFPPAVRVFVCLEVADIRKGFDGLAAVTHRLIREDPLSGHLFVFFNCRRGRVKLIFWDRSGFCIWHKRLEKGRFPLKSLDKQ